MAAKASSRRLQVARGYRRLLVSFDARTESVEALEIACRLAADDGAKITAVAVIEVPPLLPLDAHLIDAEDAARRLLERAAGATGDAYGVRVATRVVRARDVGAAIVAQAMADRDELMVIHRHARDSLSRRSAFAPIRFSTCCARRRVV